MQLQLQRRDEISPGRGNDHRAGRITVTPPHRHPSCRRRGDPFVREWLSRDPSEEQGGVNLYGFVVNNPVNEYDILGLSIIGVNWDQLNRNPQTHSCKKGYHEDPTPCTENTPEVQMGIETVTSSLSDLGNDFFSEN